MLTFKWSPELSEALPFEAKAFHGETFQLIAIPKNYAEALTGLTGATVELYWQTPDMTAAEWYVEAGSYDATTGEVSATFDGTKDTGADSITFYLALTTADGATAYRIYGRIRFKASPGFIPSAAISQMESDLRTWAEGQYLPEAKAQAEAAAKSATAAATSEQNAEQILTDVKTAGTDATKAISEALESANNSIEQTRSSAVSSVKEAQTAAEKSIADNVTAAAQSETNAKSAADTAQEIADALILNEEDWALMLSKANAILRVSDDAATAALAAATSILGE